MTNRGLALCCLALVSGCGGAAADDDTAPTVVVSASKASVEGGETLAISVNATDDVDGSLTPTLNCNGGTLDGNLLSTAPVSADAVVTCTATATDKAGNVGTGNIAITVKATVATVALPDNLTTVRQGQVGSVIVTNLVLAQPSYAARIAGRDITLARATDTVLGFVIPDDLAVGSYRMTFAIGDRSYTVPITVATAPTIADPKAAVSAVLTNVLAASDAATSANAAALTATQAEQLAANRKLVINALANLDSFDAADLRRMAVLFGSSELFATDASGQAFSSSSCNGARARAVAGFAVIAGFLTIGGFGGGGAGIVVAAAILAASGTAEKIIIRSRDQIRANCFSELSYSLDELATTQSERTEPTALTVKALAVNQRYGFKNGQPRQFVVQQTLTLDTTVSGQIAQLKNIALQTIAKLPFVPASSAAALEQFSTPEVREIPSAEVTLGEISRSDVTGTKSGAGTTVTLTFSAAASVTSNVDFDFTLNRSSGTPIALQGQLTLNEPGAEDASSQIRQNRTSQFALQVRGADRLELVEPPAHGTATLNASGAASYTPTGAYFGSDRFTYRAVNSNGVSRIATVLLTVFRQFEGVWRITTRSTTTSESRPGLCPSESYTATVNVQKFSDTVFFVDLPVGRLNLVLRSGINDPSGLYGVLTGTYDDDDGTTTETATIRVPDSDHLEGSTVFSYIEPGAACSGTNSVSGTRP